MELGTVIGFTLGVIFIVLSILMAGDFQTSALYNFYYAPSAMITLGGTIASTLIAFPLSKVVNSMKATVKIFKPPNVDPLEAIEKIIGYANLVRKEGVLTLDEASQDTDDVFLKKAIRLIVDGTDPRITKEILETEITYAQERHSDATNVWEFIASSCTTWGIIGALIALVMMLQTMDDPSSIGSKMALAVITTFYGSVLSNFIAAPIANKLRIFSIEEISIKEVLMEGMLSIQAGENPRIIEERLKSFL